MIEYDRDNVSEQMQFIGKQKQSLEQQTELEMSQIPPHSKVCSFINDTGEK